MSRAARRAAAAKARPGRPDADGLRGAVGAAKLPGTPPDVMERARRILLAGLDAMAGAPPSAVADDLASGAAARRIGLADLDRGAPPSGMACRAGCAFCCILPGADGGTVTEAEARRLHAALAPRAGAPDGRAWHADACPALDPDTRACRAYADRPLICRAYLSTDAAACEAVAGGTPAPGPGTMGGYATALAAHGIARAALRGARAVPTYALRRVAAAAVEGRDVETALGEARHSPGMLDAERRRLAKAARIAAKEPGAA